MNCVECTEKHKTLGWVVVQKS